MKSKVVCLTLIAALMLLFAFPAAAPAAPNPANAAAPAPNPHPQIQAAIYSLQQARLHLLEASHDFGGHREDAVKAIDKALHQLQICMQY
jgi:Skp family chaperone for outer membrane proteins